jgi:hypothetical protein
MPPKVGAPTGRTAAASKLSVPKAAAGAKIAAAASSSKSAAKGGGTRGDASKGGGPKTKATTTTSSAAVEKIPAAAAEIAPSSPPSKAGSAQGCKCLNVNVDVCGVVRESGVRGCITHVHTRTHEYTIATNRHSETEGSPTFFLEREEPISIYISLCLSEREKVQRAL